MAKIVREKTMKDLKLNTPASSFKKATPSTLGARTPDKAARTPDRSFNVKIKKANITKPED